MLAFSFILALVVFLLSYIAYSMYRISKLTEYISFIMDDIFKDEPFKRSIRKAKRGGSMFDKGL